jgi:hypothetical protein
MTLKLVQPTVEAMQATDMDRFLQMGEPTAPPKWLVPETEEEEEAELPPSLPPVHDHTFEDSWQDLPTVKDQLSLFPESTRVKCKRSMVFNLSDKADLNAWNEIMDLAEKGAAWISDRDRQFFEGKYHMYALVVFYQFKKLAPNIKKEKP